MISGVPGAANNALDAVYPRLRRLAQTLLIAEPNARTYQPTALVNELYLRHLRRLTLPPSKTGNISSALLPVACARFWSTMPAAA